MTREQIEEEFERFAYDNMINFALRIDERYRVDDVAVQFAEYLLKKQEAANVGHVQQGS